MLVTKQLLVAIDFHCKKKYIYIIIMEVNGYQQLFSYQLVNFENILIILNI